MTNMTVTLYQAKAGDGLKKAGMKRANTFFQTPQEAVSEALALKERMDARYKNAIQWDYDGLITGSTKKLKILKGYLGGDRGSSPFYLEISEVPSAKETRHIPPIKPKKMTLKDQTVIDKVEQFLN